MSGDQPRKPATRIVEAGRRKEWTGAVVNPPVWRGSTHLYADSADLARGRPNEDGHFYYGRRGSPTQWALAEALTELEPAAFGTALYPSGVAAIAGVLLSLLESGDTVLMTDNAYEPSRVMAKNLLAPLRIETQFFDPLDVDRFATLFDERTRAVLIESPGSLTMEVCDVPALAAVARAKGAMSVLDNTWASPLGFPALERGCDISLMSLTKHVGGHSDVMMGCASAGEELYRRLRAKGQTLGQVVSPDDAALVLRGLRTLGVRLERETASALAIAEWLAGRPEVAHVLCPILPGAPGHALWQRDFTGACGLFSFVLADGGPDARARFIDALELFGIGYSWGGYESLAIPFDPARARTCTPWPPSAWNPADRLGIRLSIGLEDPEDLMRDLDRGFSRNGERVSGASEIAHNLEPGSGPWRVVSTLDGWGFTVADTRLSVWTLLVTLVIIATALLLARLAIRASKWLLGKITGFDASQKVLAQKLVSIAVWVLTFLIVFDALGIDLTALAVFSGAFGLALGFGLQKTFGNLLAGIILLMDKSIKPGDVIAVNDGITNTVGQVKKIGLRAVSVTTRDKKEYLIPNENLMINQVENWSYSSKNVRIRVPITVAPTVDLDLAERLMIEGAKAATRVLATPPPAAWITEFTEAGVSYEIRIWINDPEEGLANVRSDVLKRVWTLFREHEIVLPNRSQREIRLESSDALDELVAALRERGFPPEQQN